MKINFSSIRKGIHDNRFVRAAAPGIQVKLSFFTGLFIAVILITSTGFHYFHQKQILEDGFQKEIEPSLKYINSVAVDFENLRHNLVLIEDMKQRIQKKQKDLLKYKTVIYRKKDSFFNSLKGFGRKLGMRVNYEYAASASDTFYSVYLSSREIDSLEKIVRSQLKYPTGEPLNDADFKKIQSAAALSAYHRRSAESAEDEIRDTRQRISELSGKQAEKESGAGLSAEIKKLSASNSQSERRLAYINKIRNRADSRLHSILKPYYDYRLIKLEETGMQGDYIRIISAGPDGVASYDTVTYMKESRLRFSPLFENEKFKADRKSFFDETAESGFTGRAAHDYAIGDKEFHVEYRPVYKNPATYERIKIILGESDKNSSRWRPYILADQEISAEIKECTGLISARVTELRDKRLPPGNDADYRKLYQRYSSLLAKRDAAFIRLNPHRELPKHISLYYKKEIDGLNKIISQYAGRLAGLREKKSDKADEIEETALEIDSLASSLDLARKNLNSLKAELNLSVQDISGSNELSAADAFHNIREAALYDFIQLKFRNDPLSYKNYLKTEFARRIERARWQTVRGWIIAAGSETGIPEFIPGFRGIKTIDNGLLAYARSEIEEYMWRLDSSPIADDTGFFGYEIGREGLLSGLMRPIVTGYNIIAVDRSDGIARITANRHIMLLYSSATALAAVVLAYFFSGFIVRRIKRIKVQAGSVQAGDLMIEFPQAGLDEIEDLAQSLNAMMKGLREKEDMKSELAAAGEIQKQLLPERIPQTLEGLYSTAAYYKAMQGVGGDYYDFIELGPGRLLFCVGDVSNHGVGPAIVMASVRAHVRGITSQGESGLIKILLQLNERLFIDTPGHIFVTFFIAVLDASTNVISYASAGHMRPLVYRYKKETVETLEGGGLPLGMDDNSFFSETISLSSVKLSPGDIFFQYTDGLTEAMDNNRNIYGDERLISAIGGYGRKKIEVMMGGIASSIEEFTGTDLSIPGFSQLGDDLAMVAIKRLK